MKKLFILFTYIILFTAACAPRLQPSFVIKPDQCKIPAGEKFPISLEGSNIPTNGKITWSVSRGQVQTATDAGMVYQAPQEPGIVYITAELESQGVKFSKSLTCEIIEAETVVSPVELPTETPIPTQPSASVANTIAITEVMSTPCGGGSGAVPNRNEYLELYNYGSTSVDVMGWWIATTGGGDGTPDQIVPWKTANPGVSLGNNVVIDQSLIPPGRFAIVLSPKYPTGAGEYYMPYAFPKDTIILSFSTSKYLGNDTTGLVGTKSDMSMTVIVLYQGTQKIISNVVSTYGTPTYGSSPNNVQDDKLDKFPYSLPDCRSMERINASGPDNINNWHDINMGNPGMGDYSHN